MSAPNKQRASGVPVFMVFGMIFIVLTGLVFWQPKAATWISEAADAESSRAPDEAAPVRFAAEPTRRPIHPAAWTQVIDSRK